MVAAEAVSPEVTEFLTEDPPTVVFALMLRTAAPDGTITAVPRRAGALAHGGGTSTVWGHLTGW